MNKELIASKFFKHLDDTALIGYSDFHEHFDDLIVSVDFYRIANEIKTIEVLDKNWDIDKHKTSELKDYLIPLFIGYEYGVKDSIKQQKEIREDEKR